MSSLILAHNEIRNFKQKAESLAKHFENAHNATSSMKSPVEEKVNECFENVENAIDNEESYSLTNVDVVKNIISQLKNSNPPELDNVHNIVLKRRPPPELALLVNVFNFCLSHSCFPKVLK